MDIIFKTRKLAKECNDARLAQKKHGDKRAKLLRRRLDELNSAATLEDMRFLPAPRCHELKQNRKGQLSVDLDHPYRLIFQPAHDPMPTKPDGGLNWSRVTSIEIIGIEDTHE